jgi:predicted HAD superfamily Cof-like phosphohydrolase
MRTLANMVLQFHTAFGLPTGTKSGLPSLQSNRRELRQKLLREEFHEYCVAERNNDLVEIADALGDMAYIIWGTALEYGIPLDKVIEEIHRSNMSKLDWDFKPIMREDGKVLKSERYTPPDIKRILDEEADRV